MTTATRKPTAVPAPTTAAEAKALADRLAAAEHDLAERRRAATQAAKVAACQDLLDSEADQLAAAAANARTEWDTAIGDDTIGLDGLFTLWTNLRRASAVRATHVAQASATWDSLEPIRNDRSGQPTTHRLDVHDSMAPRGEMTWAHAIEDVIQQRVNKAHKAAEQSARDRISQAGIDAAAAVK
jgi:hypothetical protein